MTAAGDQGEVVAFLSAPATHGTPGPVEIVETHISRIFLAGNRAFKLKRAVRLPYADFSTPEIRLATCEREHALNAPHAPGLYLGVRRITRAPGGGLEFDGPGELADAVVEMARFGQADLLASVADRGELTPALIEKIVAATVRWHRDAPAQRDISGSARIAGVLDINRAGFATSTVFSPAEADALDRAFRAGLQRHRETLDRRAAQGLVRRCHGDLHLGNICLFEGRPTPFDCIEFSDEIATVDVLYDLAFLLMDLWARGLETLAGLAANRYCDATGEDAGFALLPYFMALRAAVRAHVTATRAEGAAGDARRAIAAEARRHFDLALALLRPAPPVAVAIGGFSGTGKTTVAEALAPRLAPRHAPPPGARIVESDRTRKAMFGVPSETRLPAAAYTPQVSEQVYRKMAERAGAVLRAGAGVVVDAVFDRPERRDAVQAALERAAPGRFAGFWLEAPAETLRARVRRRRGGPSDATVEVLEGQLAGDPGPLRWQRLRADRPVAETVAGILARLSAPDGAAGSGAGGGTGGGNGNGTGDGDGNGGGNGNGDGAPLRTGRSSNR